MQAEQSGHENQPWMVAANECEVKKLVFLAIRPTLMHQPELSILRSASRFVAEYVAYEPPADPSRPPAHLISPQTTLDWQVRLSALNLRLSTLMTGSFDGHNPVE